MLYISTLIMRLSMKPQAGGPWKERRDAEDNSDTADSHPYKYSLVRDQDG